jgi:putative phosphonate catabolism associated alcohol dehydrogenase
MASAQVFEGAGKPQRLQQQQFPARLNHGEVLVSIDLATICGSDLHTLAGHRKAPTPCILGHEAVGRVVESGDGRAGLRPGDRVTWSIADSCGQCPPCTEYDLPQKCQSLFKYGHAALGDATGLNGCYASHIVLRSGTHLAKVPDALSDGVVAPANCALATMVNAVSNVPPVCAAAVIQGAGLLGLYGCALLRERGVKSVFCIDLSESRLARVPQFGGIPVDGRPEAYEETRKVIFRSAPGGVDVVLEVAGVSSLVPEGIRLLRPGGYYGLIGMVHPNSPIEVTGEEIIRKCLVIRGVHNYAPRHLDAALIFLEKTLGQYPYDSLVSPPFSLKDIEVAVAEAGSGRWPRVSVKAGIAK